MKRLIVLCDGTGQSSYRTDCEGAFPTNMKNFGDCLEQAYTAPDGNTVQQIIYYQSGIGTSTVSQASKALAGMSLPWYYF